MSNNKLETPYFFLLDNSTQGTSMDYYIVALTADDRSMASYQSIPKRERTRMGLPVAFDDGQPFVEWLMVLEDDAEGIVFAGCPPDQRELPIERGKTIEIVDATA